MCILFLLRGGGSPCPFEGTETKNCCSVGSPHQIAEQLVALGAEWLRCARYVGETELGWTHQAVELDGGQDPSVATYL